MRRQIAAGATGSSIGLSALAAAIGLCCVAPWAVALMGVSGAVALAGLGPYRPYFIVVAAMFFAVAIWAAYRRRNRGGAVACSRHSRWLTLLFTLNALLLLAAVFAGSIQVVIQRHLSF